jgi:cardiolipin synthase
MARALDRSTGTRAIPGNAIVHLPGGPQALAAMRRLIAEAQRWVHFENYIIRDDSTGRVFAEDFVAAVARGVRVRVLYDAFGCRWTRSRYWRRLRDAGVEVRVFNPVNALRPIRSTRRDHRKYVGVDNARAIVGGLCIGDEWAGDESRNRKPWRDTAALICGPAATALEQTFWRVWRAGRGPGTAPEPEAAAPACGEAVVRVIDGVPGSSRVYRVIQLLGSPKPIFWRRLR